MAVRSRSLGAALLVLSLIAVGLSLYSAYKWRGYVACQAAYNEVNNQRTRYLTDVVAREREAERARGDTLDAVFTDPALLKPAEQRTPADTKRIRERFTAYLDAAVALRVERAAADRARTDHPVPPPPSQICGA